MTATQEHCLSAAAVCRTPAPELTASEVESRRALLAAFDGFSLEDGERRLVVDATIVSCTEHGIEPWLWFDTPFGDIALAVLRLDGGPAGWPATRAALFPPALASMSRLEFALQALESNGPTWTPSRFAPVQGLGVRLDLKADDGALVHQLALWVDPATCANLPARPVDLSRAPARARLPVKIALAGSYVPRAELASLAIGDLVLLGEGVRSAQISLEGGLGAEGLFDPALHQFRLDEALRPLPKGDYLMPLTEGCSHLDETSTRLTLLDVPVRLGFELGPWSRRLADLVSLEPGSILTGLDDEGSQVRVTVEGRSIARGRLVSLGRCYGVLIEAVER